jgi:hypothetical protein
VSRLALAALALALAGSAACGLAGLSLMVGGAGVAHAQTSALFPRPWRPAGGDTLHLWASESRALLHGSRSPELTDNELRAYALQDRIAKAYFRALGPNGMRAAAGLYTTLDSLELKARISQKDGFPTFVFVQFLNPDFESYASLGYLYWFRGDELRSQPINLKGGHDADLQVLWTGEEAGPYEAGLLYYQGIGRDRAPELLLLRMTPRGDAWLPVQVGDADLHLGNKGTAAWVDLDRDAKPELVSWTEGAADTLFGPCQDVGCPELITERVFVRGPGGFQLYQQMSVASPFATLVLFLRSLARGEEAFARTLTGKPEVMAKARELGWDRALRARAFQPLASPAGERWPERLRLSYESPNRTASLLEVRFVSVQGHWLINDVAVLRQVSEPGGRVGKSSSGPASRGPAGHSRTSRAPRKTPPPAGDKRP